jgi:glycine/serine hydroxymethyltransferase
MASAVMKSAAAEITERRWPGCFGVALAESDPDLAAAVKAELGRQQHEIELIASENIVSRAVLKAQGSVLTNKYAEGYPGKRYYGGCQYVDVAEQLAIDRAKRLFDCGFANVQPHSGAQANGAVNLALLSPGDTILGMSLDAGGHLTHGAKPAMSGKWFKAVQYGVRAEDGLIDFEQIERLADEHRPKLHCRRLGLFPLYRLRALPPDRECGRRLVSGRHGAHRRAGRRRRASFADTALSRCHHHYP